MPKLPHKPLVWLPACHRHLDLSDPGGYTVLADRYAAAVTALGLQPVLFPMAEAGDVPSLLQLVDGVLLTGSPSNVEATHFGATALPTDLLDPRRDRLTMRLVREALAAGVQLVLLDNFGLAETVAAVDLARGTGCRLEASGGLSLDRAREVAATGVDYLAVGALTHSAPVLDLGFDLRG